MAFNPAIGRAVRLIWKAARAVRAVRRTQEFSRAIVSKANEVVRQHDLGPDASDREIAEACVASGVRFKDGRPNVRDFIEGPDETRAEHVASSREFQRRR